MKVGPVLGELVEEAFAATIAVVACGGCGVHGDEDVGHNATAAVDSAPARGFVFQGVGELDRVGGEHFAVFVTTLDVFIVGVGTIVVGTLDAPAAGGVVAGGGDTHLRAVLEVVHGLHKAFTVGASADDKSSVPVLYGTTDNFGCRSGAFVDKHHQVALAEGAIANRLEILTAAGTSLLIDNKFAGA